MGTMVTEATYHFDIVESNHESPFKDFYASNTAINFIRHSPVLAPPCKSQTHDDFLIAQVLQEELQNAQDPEIECLHADIIPGPTNDNDKEYFPTNQTNIRYQNVTIDDLDIDKYCEEQVNSNTNRKTKSDMKMLNAFMLEVLKDNRDICQIPDNELNTIICKFIINVCQRNGSEYEPNTVKGIVASIDRHIRSNNYGNSIKKGDAFNQACRVLTAKTMDLKKNRKG